MCRTGRHSCRTTHNDSQLDESCPSGSVPHPDRYLVSAGRGVTMGGLERPGLSSSCLFCMTIAVIPGYTVRSRSAGYGQLKVYWSARLDSLVKMTAGVKHQRAGRRY